MSFYMKTQLLTFVYLCHMKGKKMNPNVLIYILLLNEKPFARAIFHKNTCEDAKYFFLTGYCMALGSEWMFDSVHIDDVSISLPEINFHV